eukprot:TRINITY_DN6003_c0_g1_i1.p1 TRINITY_DN6003_c0_g1~~TRINITY_DN6003_c0_g1_i1.p1  ORF type:complete len:368 (-),score=74.40 TRINITY_DN6003_c0_g1_i1:48-1151(-)
MVRLLLFIACVLLGAFSGAFYVLPRFIVTAEPNEWLLHISDGHLMRAGVGITCHLGLLDTAVRFPSAIHKVNFSAQQVSVEMQGIEVEGFIVWSVYREGDGPLKAFKYLNGLTREGIQKANLHVGGMTESIIRHQVANMQLHQVIQGRDQLREKVRSEMMAVLQGWGMWLETVEVTDVRVLSQRLFDDLQSEFRLSLHSHAEGLRLNTSRMLEEQKLEHDTHLKDQRRVAQQQNELKTLKAALELEQEQALAAALRHERALQQLERNKTLRLQEAAADAEVAQQRLQAELQVLRERAEADREVLLKKLEVEAKMSPASLQKHLMETTREVFAKLPLRDVKLYNTGADSLHSLIPGLTSLLDDINKSK